MKTVRKSAQITYLKNQSMSNKKIVVLMAIPCILLLIAFSYLPIAGWIIAFFQYKPGLNLFQCQFVGFKYFAMIFTEPDLFNVLRNTLVFSFIGLALTPLPVIFAIMMSEISSKRYRSFIQTMTTLPNFVSWVIVYGLFYALFTSDQSGLVNNVMMALGLRDKPYNIFGDVNAVYSFQTAMLIWKTLGFGSIIYLAAIVGIDQEMYDAADVDGAGRFQKMRYITLPNLVPTYVTMLILNIGGILNNGFDQYYNFYNKLVHDNIQVLDLYLYRVGIALNSFSFSTALGILKTLISVLLLFVTSRIIKKLSGRSIF